MTAHAGALVYAAAGRAMAPRKPMTVSQWADAERILSAKGSAEPGKWRTSRNPLLQEPMDCLSARSSVRDVVLKFPIQIGKTEVAVNFLGYTMDQDPSPMMVCLPGEVSMEKWVAQKLNPMLEETPVVKRSLTSVASRDSSNRRTFKDFSGGQLYIEHAGSPSRLKSTTVKKLVVDEVDEFAGNLTSGDDPVEMLNGRTSAFPSTYKALFISTPGVKGISRIDFMYEESDQRRFHLPCPDCGHLQPLEWSGLQWTPDGTDCWYVCRECGVVIREHQKTAMFRAGRWIPQFPGRAVRGYTANCLYYQIGLGPRWIDLVRKWRAAQNDPAKLKTFVNDRLAEAWEDPAMRAVKHNVIADRAEPYSLRTAPRGVLAMTVGVDTQDNRLAVHFIGWGRGLTWWTIDYVELPGDPAEDAVWDALTELLNKGIEHELGGTLVAEASAVDAGGHRTEAVKAFVRARRVRRPLCIFGAVPNNAPVLSKGKLEDVTWRGKVDKRGVMIHHVGTVGIKHWLYSRLSVDADKNKDRSDKTSADRLCHMSDELPPDYFGGLVAETYNPSKNRFEKRKGAPRNEPLDTWVYAYAAAHHPELRLHRLSKADWDAREARLTVKVAVPGGSSAPPAAASAPPPREQPAQQPNTRRRGGFATTW
ncbi:phage terminase large subunit family protein [Dyella sp.]|uniref:phage terminase large subunit family protein n=1 Tax=Dyella sp. TaxID=1869338 RepID=UPI00284B05BE|nr:phage terminase large subunit family protein [Dyella sp.]MDR3444708.1 phage terminase large subunit family protein [Dyella sp.]